MRDPAMIYWIFTILVIVAAVAWTSTAIGQERDNRESAEQ